MLFYIIESPKKVKGSPKSPKSSGEKKKKRKNKASNWSV